MEENIESEFRSGFVALIGKPNVGKSTLLNRLLGQPIAGVSAKPQTTRRRQLGILTSKEYQIVFVDTPGLTDAKDKLARSINSEVQFALNDSDLLLLLVDASNPQDPMDEKLLEPFRHQERNRLCWSFSTRLTASTNPVSPSFPRYIATSCQTRAPCKFRRWMEQA